MKFTSSSSTTAVCTILASAGISQAAVLYQISSFDPTDSTNTSSNTVRYDPDLVAITTAPGLNGTTAAQLNALQTINTSATMGNTSPRFQNTDIDTNQTNGTLIADESGDGTRYFQFGISGGNSGLSLTSLVFQAKQATPSAGLRGYNVVYSINGGAYIALGSAVVAADRNSVGVFDTVTLPLSNTSVSSVDFRVNSTVGGIEYANFTLNGVPEPSTTILAVLSVAGLLGIRRRS